MDKVFLDTNVLLDHLAMRPPFDRAANTFFERAEDGQIELFASSLSFCNIAYILPKLSSRADIPKILDGLSQIVTITSIDGDTIAAALASGMKDFEDAIQLFSAAHHGGIQCLVTRNPTDFVNAIMRIETPEGFLLSNP